MDRPIIELRELPAPWGPGPATHASTHGTHTVEVTFAVDLDQENEPAWSLSLIEPGGRRIAWHLLTGEQSIDPTFTGEHQHAFANAWNQYCSTGEHARIIECWNYQELVDDIAWQRNHLRELEAHITQCETDLARYRQDHTATLQALEHALACVT